MFKIQAVSICIPAYKKIFKTLVAITLSANIKMVSTYDESNYKIYIISVLDTTYLFGGVIDSCIGGDCGLGIIIKSTANLLEIVLMDI